MLNFRLWNVQLLFVYYIFIKLLTKSLMENDILIQETLQGLFNERMNRFDPESKLSLADTFACRTETDRRGSRITTVAKPVPSYIISRRFFGESEKSKPVINQLSHPELQVPRTTSIASGVWRISESQSSLVKEFYGDRSENMFSRNSPVISIGRMRKHVQNTNGLPLPP